LKIYHNTSVQTPSLYYFINLTIPLIYHNHQKRYLWYSNEQQACHMGVVCGFFGCWIQSGMPCKSMW